MPKENELAFITGAAGGIGSASARYFHNKGYRLWLTDIDEKGLESLKSSYPKARIDKVDLCNKTELQDLCERIENKTAPLTLGFVNAGVIKPGASTTLEASVIDFHISVNLTAAAYLNRSLAIKMSAQGEGQIISTVSSAGLVSLPESAAYAASKFGLRGYLLSLAQEVRDKGVVISLLYPNAIDTPMLRDEATHGGSVLNFLSEPSTTDDIVAAIDKIVRTGKLETFVPSSDRLSIKFFAIFPGLLTKLLPRLQKAGRAGRDKFVKKHKLK